MKRVFLLLAVVGIVAGVALIVVREMGSGEPGPDFGDVVDEFTGVSIYYNGAVSTTKGRHLAPDGYNFGLKYQCVEFVKRYYYEALDHQMPNTWGHAKDFFDPEVEQGQVNLGRGLLQFRNGGAAPPEVHDLIVFGPSPTNGYGHVAIVSGVGEGEIEIVQQNPGPQGHSRVFLKMREEEGGWAVGSRRVLGWLRLRTAEVGGGSGGVGEAILSEG
jgi:surface antigen